MAYLNFEELVESRASSVDRNLVGRNVGGAVVPATVMFNRRAKLGNVQSIGDYCLIDYEANLESGIVLGSESVVGQGAKIEEAATLFMQSAILGGSVIGRKSELRFGVVVNSGLKIPDETQLGDGALVPSQKTLVVLGRFGEYKRMVTIHGSYLGPMYSIGCQFSVPWSTIQSRINAGTGTSEASAGHYRPYLDEFNGIGNKVQMEFDKEQGAIEEMLAQAEGYRDTIAAAKANLL